QLSLESKNDVQRHFTLGLLLASEKRYKTAEFELEKADSLKPGTFEILYNLGQVYLSSGNYSNAELVLHRALSLKPDSADAMYLLAQVFQEESRETYVRASSGARSSTSLSRMPSSIKSRTMLVVPILSRVAYSLMLHSPKRICRRCRLE
ncbi:tetratricopeptide repeat protein, partial [Lacticaseibacillus rhamnosus]